MTRTVYGELCSPDGLASDRTVVQGARGPELRFKGWATPAGEVLERQAKWIGVDRDHQGPWVGHVIHLERRHGRLWCVAELSDEFTPTVAVKVGTEIRSVATPFYFSVDRTATNDFRNVVIESVGLVHATARLSGRPVTFCDGDTVYAAAHSSDHLERELLKRARAAQTSRHGGPIVVQDLDREARWDRVIGRSLDDPQVAFDVMRLSAEDRMRMQPLEYRPSRIISVR